MAKPPSHTLTFPRYVILTADCHGPVLVPVQDGTRGLPVFCNEALLRDYRTLHRLQGPLVRFDRAAQLLRYLDTLPAGVASMVLDPVFAAYRVDLTTLRAELAAVAATEPLV